MLHWYHSNVNESSGQIEMRVKRMIQLVNLTGFTDFYRLLFAILVFFSQLVSFIPCPKMHIRMSIWKKIFNKINYIKYMFIWTKLYMYEYIDAYFTIHRFIFSKHFSEGYFEYCKPFAIIKFIMKLRAQIALTGLWIWFCNLFIYQYF